jgi:hypothetical protein
LSSLDWLPAQHSNWLVPFRDARQQPLPATKKLEPRRIPKQNTIQYQTALDKTFKMLCARMHAHVSCRMMGTADN